MNFDITYYRVAMGLFNIVKFKIGKTSCLQEEVLLVKLMIAGRGTIGKTSCLQEEVLLVKLHACRKRYY